MPVFLCTACGSEFPPAAQTPAHCPICEDARQYVPAAGQGWTTQERLAAGHANSFRQHAPGFFAIRTVPAFAIDQRAFLVPHPEGGFLLWDCLALLDAATIALIRALGGLRGIAISHPHYYTSCVSWSRAFDDAPVYLHAADREWVMRPDPCQVFWEGETRMIADGLTLIRAGGHFPGGTVLHWAGGAAGQGALLSGDIAQVVADRRSVSFMRSYPNLIPLAAPMVRRIAARLEPFAFAAVYGAFAGREILDDGKGAVMRSVARYLDALAGDDSDR
ncbi:MAG: MBL fold metallo-hydrolase [Rhodospirillales bacterium]|nr:MBL fold metallo-hydrolase [Rhodospirillales bacterium]